MPAERFDIGAPVVRASASRGDPVAVTLLSIQQRRRARRAPQSDQLALRSYDLFRSTIRLL